MPRAKKKTARKTSKLTPLEQQIADLKSPPHHSLLPQELLPLLEKDNLSEEEARQLLSA